MKQVPCEVLFTGNRNQDLRCREAWGPGASAAQVWQWEAAAVLAEAVAAEVAPVEAWPATPRGESAARTTPNGSTPPSSSAALGPAGHRGPTHRTSPCSIRRPTRNPLPAARVSSGSLPDRARPLTGPTCRPRGTSGSNEWSRWWAVGCGGGRSGEGERRRWGWNYFSRDIGLFNGLKFCIIYIFIWCCIYIYIYIW